jgi:two-component system KDP operon response regulator KdpE
MNRPTGEPLVLVLADDPQARGVLASVLAEHGMRYLLGGTRLTARSMIGHAHDVVLLDAGLSGKDPIGPIKRLRKRTAVPIVTLLGPAPDEDRAAVLEAGANDYLVKPFTTEDLVVRLRVWLRHSARAAPPEAPAQRPPHLRLDRELRCLFVEGLEVHVTPLEYKLLDLLARAGGVGMTEEQLVRNLWGRKAARSVQYLRSHVRRLRQKIEVDPDRPRHLLSEASGGYRLELG